MSKHQELYLDIICKILLLEKEMIKNEISQENLEIWDSMTHLALVSEFEQVFGIFLSDDDILAMKTIGDIKRILGKHGIKVV